MEQKMYRSLLLTPLLFLASAACAEQTPVGKAQVAPIDSIAFHISSWGRPIDSWDVRADGTAHHAKMVSDAGAPFGTYRLEHREFTIAADDFARLAAIAAKLPQPRLQRDDCEQRVTDFPYGALEISQSGTTETIAFDTGCQDAPYQAFFDQLRALDERVTALAGGHPVARVEQVGGS
jgi:hypothetical protein